MQPTMQERIEDTKADLLTGQAEGGTCPSCDSTNYKASQFQHGADADGNRGERRFACTCLDCGEEWEE